MSICSFGKLRFTTSLWYQVTALHLSAEKTDRHNEIAYLSFDLLSSGLTEGKSSVPH